MTYFVCSYFSTLFSYLRLLHIRYIVTQFLCSYNSTLFSYLKIDYDTLCVHIIPLSSHI